MKKVVNIYYVEKPINGNCYATGLVLELEDGRFMSHGSTDVLQPFTEITKSSLEDGPKEKE